MRKTRDRMMWLASAFAAALISLSTSAEAQSERGAAARAFDGQRDEDSALLPSDRSVTGKPSMARPAMPSPPTAPTPQFARHDFPDGGSLQVRPARLMPGELFEFEIVRPDIEAPTLQLGTSRFETFAVAPGRWRGYGAVRVDAAPGHAALTVEWRAQGRQHRRQASLHIEPKEFPRRKLKVAGKFTRPTAAQKAQNRADQKAFSAAYAAAMSPPMFEENFANPVSDVARVTSAFGVRRIFNGQTKSRHLGLDLDGEIGTPIYAAADGVVRMKRSCFYAGNAIVLSHGAGIFTAYFHLSEFAVEEGQRVEKGQRLGEMGKTGRVTGPHLHLTAKVGETTFDPASLLSFDFFPEDRALPLAEGNAVSP